jgi:hypothetical protein
MATDQQLDIRIHGAQQTQSPTHGGLQPPHGGKGGAGIGPIHGLNGNQGASVTKYRYIRLRTTNSSSPRALPDRTSSPALPLCLRRRRSQALRQPISSTAWAVRSGVRMDLRHGRSTLLLIWDQTQPTGSIPMNFASRRATAATKRRLRETSRSESAPTMFLTQPSSPAQVRSLRLARPRHSLLPRSFR